MPALALDFTLDSYSRLYYRLYARTRWSLIISCAVARRAANKKTALEEQAARAQESPSRTAATVNVAEAHFDTGTWTDHC